jgi:hypothetical protein
MEALEPAPMTVEAMTGDASSIIGRRQGNMIRWTGSGAAGVPGPTSWPATDITLDGQTIVGHNGPGIIRWDSGAVTSQEFTPPDRTEPLTIQTVGISGNGSTLVAQGEEGLGGGTYVVIERDDLSMMVLRDYITDELGLDLSDWNPHGSFELGGISDDGQVISGTAINADGWREAWVLVIPEPSTGVLVATGLFVLSVTRRGRAR